MSLPLKPSDGPWNSGMCAFVGAIRRISLSSSVLPTPLNITILPNADKKKKILAAIKIKTAVEREYAG